MCYLGSLEILLCMKKLVRQDFLITPLLSFLLEENSNSKNFEFITCYLQLKKFKHLKHIFY